MRFRSRVISCVAGGARRAEASRVPLSRLRAMEPDSGSAASQRCFVVSSSCPQRRGGVGENTRIFRCGAACRGEMPKRSVRSPAHGAQGDDLPPHPSLLTSTHRFCHLMGSKGPSGMSRPSARAACRHAATKLRTNRSSGRRSPLRASEAVLTGTRPFDNPSILLREGLPAAT